MVTETGQEDAFIREVDEEYRRDRLIGLWTRYGRTLMIVIGLALVALAGFLFWREEQAKVAGERAESFTQALLGLEQGDQAAVTKVEALAKDGGPGYSAIARLAQAAAASRAGDTQKALDIYNALVADKQVGKPLRDLAQLKALRLEFDTLPADKLIATLRPMAQPGGPWFAVAGEMLAAAYLRDGKADLAGPLFTEIAKDQTAPASLRTRASQMAAMLGALPPEMDASEIAAPQAADMSAPQATDTSAPQAAAPTKAN